MGRNTHFALQGQLDLLDVLLSLMGPCHVAGDELDGRQLALPHGLLHFVNCRFMELEAKARVHWEQIV